MQLSNSFIFSFIFKVSSILPKFVKSIVFDESKNSQQIALELYSQRDVLPVLQFLKKHSAFLFLSIAELTAVD